MSALGEPAKNVTERERERILSRMAVLHVLRALSPRRQFHLIMPLKRGFRRSRVSRQRASFHKETCIGSETDVTYAGFLRLLSYFILYYFIKSDEGKGINRVPIPREN